MAQNANITIKNAAATNVVLTPQYKDGFLSVYMDRTAVAGLRTELSLGMRKPSASVSNDKVTLKIMIPYEVVADDSTTIEQASAFIDFVIPKTASADVRNNLKAAVNTVCTDAIVIDLVVNQGFPY